MPVTSAIFCPLCDEFYDESTRRPMVCRCGFTICATCCREEVRKCECCRKMEKFIWNVHAYECIEHAKKSMTTKIIAELVDNNKTCKQENEGGQKCNATTRKPRICATCHGGVLLSQDYFKNWRLNEPNSLLISQLDARIICSDCAIDHHIGHQILEVSKLDGQLGTLDHLLKLKGFEAILEKKEGELGQMALQIDIWRQVDYWSVLDDEIVARRIYEDRPFQSDTLGMLKMSKEEMRERKMDKYLGNEQLRERIRIGCVESIDEHVEVLKRKCQGTDEQIEKMLKDYEEVRERLNKPSKVTLDEEQIQLIDAKTISKMEEIESIQSSGSYLHLHSPFFKYRALITEIRRIHVEREKVVEEILEKYGKNEKFHKDIFLEQAKLCDELRELHRVLENEENGQDRMKTMLIGENMQFLHIKLVENLLEMDNLILARLSVAHDQLLAILMRMMYFSVFPQCPHEQVYSQLISYERELRFFP